MASTLSRFRSAIVLTAVLLTGCSHLKFSEDKFGSPTLESNRQLNRLGIQEVIHERVSASTTNRLVVRGYVSDQVAALEYLSKITADLRAISEQLAAPK